jgi:hypothetical protein
VERAGWERKEEEAAGRRCDGWVSVRMSRHGGVSEAARSSCREGGELEGFSRRHVWA